MRITARSFALLSLASCGLFPAVSEARPSSARNRRAPSTYYDPLPVVDPRAFVNNVDNVQTCNSTDPVTVKASHSNIWDNLGLNETSALYDWLMDKEQGLNLTAAANATVSDNYIWLMETLPPNKTEALSYLDGNGTKPEKYARVVVFAGGLENPAVHEYKVGPVPLSNATYIAPLTYIYQNNSIPWNARYSDDVEFPLLDNVIASFMSEIAEASQSLLGGVYRGLDNDTLAYDNNAPLGYDGSYRRSWYWFLLPGDGFYLLNLPFWVQVDSSGTDPSLWSIRKAVYGDKIFYDTKTLNDAFHKGDLKPLPHPKADNITWASRDKVGPPRPLDDRAGPRNVAFDGARLQADVDEKFVSWQDWTFYISSDRDKGLTIWDIHFKGDRIIYEVGIQDAIAHYTGGDPSQATSVYLDRYYGMGQLSAPLVDEYDCPTGGLKLNATVHQPTPGAFMNPNSICIFEMDTGLPISRHFELGGNAGYSFYGSTKGYALVVRQISTVYNYDYLFDYLFYLDGTMEVRVAASGYLQSGYWTSATDVYGTRIWESTMGALHDHVLNYKLDLDVAGTKNTLHEIAIKLEEVNFPFLDPEDNPVHQKKLVKSWITNENSSKIRWPANSQNVYLIANKNETNAWGQPKGYRIQPGYSSIYNTLEAKLNKHNANYGKYNFAVSKRKDTEPSSSATWNQNLPLAPTVDFDKFFDGEDIEQEDLVVWFNLGMHHVPRAEDTPNTVTTGSRSSMIIAPFNYGDMEASRDSLNAVLMHPAAQASADGIYANTIDDYGVEPEFCLPPAVPALTYQGPIIA